MKPLARSLFVKSVCLLLLVFIPNILFAVEQSGKFDTRIEAEKASQPAASLLFEKENAPNDNNIPYFRKPVWHVTALSVAAVSIWMANEESYKYNQLAKENAVLKTRYDLSSDQAEIDMLKSEYNDNVDRMNKYESNIMYMQTLTVLALAWEAYMVYDLYNNNEAQNSTVRTETGKYRFWFSTVDRSNSQSINLSLSWRF